MLLERAPPPAEVSDVQISHLLEELAAGDPESLITIGDVVAALDERAFGLAIFVFAFPNAIPGPAIPGMSAVLGLPIILLGLQMAMGWEEPRLPRILLRRSFTRGDLVRLLRRAKPWLAWLERRCHARPGWLVSAAGERVVGAFVTFYAFVLALPIPLGNLVPAWGIVLTALGISEQDSRTVRVGLLVGMAGAAWNVFLLSAGWAALTQYLPRLF